MAQSYLTAAGTNLTQDDLGLAVANAAIASGQPRVAKVTASSNQLLGPLVHIGLDDARGQTVAVAETGETVHIRVGETVTAGTDSPYLTAGANSRWFIADPGEYYAVRLLFDGRATIAAGDFARAVVVHGQVDTAA